MGTHQVQVLARHLAHDEAHLGHQDHCQWLVSVPPSTVCEDEMTELPQDPLPLGLQAFVMEMGMTTEPRDGAQRAVGPAHVCTSVCMHVCVWCVHARVGEWCAHARV